MNVTLRRVIRCGLLLAAGSALFAVPREAEAIPAFARANQVPCTLCHVGFPKLNRFGEEFEHRGFRMPGQEGKYLWEQPVPLAGRINGLAQVQSDHWSPEVQPTDTTTGYTNSIKSGLSLFDWQILGGGTITPNVSFFGQLVGKVQGLGPDDSDTAAERTDHGTTAIRTEVFWVQLNDVYGHDGTMNLRAGIDHIDNHFLSTPLRLTHADYLIQFQPGHVGASLHPLAYGVGLNGSLHHYGLDYDVGIRNYTPFYDSKEGNEQRLGAYYAVVNKQIAENTVSFMVTGDKAGNANLDQDGMTIGWGVSLDVHLGELNFIPGLFWYRDKSGAGSAATAGGDTHDHDGATDPGTTTPGTPDEHVHNGTGGHAETFASGLEVFSGTVSVTYQFQPSLLGTLRYDFNDFDVKDEAVNRNARQYVASLAWYQSPNVRWIFEYSRLLTSHLAYEGEPGLASLVTSDSNLTQNKVLLRLDVGF